MSFFQFKQFTIQQSQCALKVCTDACLFGAWMASKLKNEHRILDIGSGTGLLTLMLAQNSQSSIDGIEIDPPSAAQSAENLMASPWFSRLRIVQEDARTYISPEPYDLVISNPPFFKNDLPSHSPKEQVDGRMALLLPFHRKEEWMLLAAKNNWHLEAELWARQTPKHTPFRWMALFNKNPVVPAMQEEIYIQQSDGAYSPEFIHYLAPYYLKL
jgi:tRNA1Val (adenine37-N6)-methyltransferase